MSSTANAMKTIIVTGGAGFIGSAFVRLSLKKNYKVIVLDALTYAGHRPNLAEVESSPNFEFVHGNIKDYDLVLNLLQKNKVNAIVHFAAESHVDNSINGPAVFVETNINGTFSLLESSRTFVRSGEAPADFRFVHVSTDEVFGELGPTGKFSETTPYAPNSPYSASKAGSDFLVRAWHETYGLNTVTTNCSNNYGPRQFPEKLIPRMITTALREEFLPVYGKGLNIRDWIHVEDHSRGVLLALEKGVSGQTYCFGGDSERTNLHVVETLCAQLDKIRPRKNGESYSKLIRFVEDRQGHDFRYAIDDSKAAKELGFSREYKNFEAGLEATIKWYLENEAWLASVHSRSSSK